MGWIAFGVLVWMALELLRLPARKYLRAVSGIMVCILVAGVIGYGAHVLMHPLAPWLRMLLATVVILGITGLLLAYTQGLSLRTASRAMKGEAEPTSAHLAEEAAAEPRE